MLLVDILTARSEELSEITLHVKSGSPVFTTFHTNLNPAKKTQSVFRRNGNETPR